MWSTKRRLGVDHPIFRFQRFCPILKVGRVGQFAKASVELQPPLGKRLLEVGEELAAKQATEWLYRQKEVFLPDRNPALPVL